MKKIILLIVLLSLIPTSSFAKKKTYALPEKQINIHEEFAITYPPGLVQCLVYNQKSLQDAVNRATWQGACEEIVMRPGSDMYGDYLTLQYEKPLVIADFNEASVGHPLILINETGKFVLFKAPKNSGCSIIVKKPQVVVTGFGFEGALCYDEDLSNRKRR